MAEIHESSHLIHIHLELKITLFPVLIPNFFHDTSGVILHIVVVSGNVPS